MSDSGRDKPGRTERTVKGNASPNANKSAVNALDSMMGNFLANNLNTAALVTVSGVNDTGPEGAAGTVTCQPMVSPTDNFGAAMPTAEAFELPYFRYQGGKAAVVVDPQPGDVGLVVYTKADSSGAGPGQEGPAPPASDRPFDPANGFYLGGFKNEPPEIWIELNKDGEINIHGKADIKIETEANLTIKAAKITLEGPVETSGGLNTSGALSTPTATFDTHTHTGDSGGATSPPTGGS
jgi:hypothetical protein